MFIGYGTILASIGGLKLEQAIQLQASDAKARAFARSSLLIGGPLTLLLASILSAAGWFGWLPGGSGWRPDWLASLPAYAWLVIVLNSTTAWHIRRARFALIARLRWWVAGCIAALQIGAASIDLGLAGQIWGTVLGTLVGLLIGHADLLREHWQRPGPRRSLEAHAASAAECLREWRKPSIDLVLAALCGTAAWQVPPVLVHEFWGADAAGWYTLAFRLASAPLALAHAAISDVAYRETTIRLQSGTGLREYVLRSSATLFALATVIAVAVVLAAPIVVPVVLGPKWHWVINLLPWMMLAVIFRTTGGTLTLFTQTGRTRLLLAWQATLLIAHLICFNCAHLAGLDLIGVNTVAALVQSALYLFLAIINFTLASSHSTIISLKK